MPRPDPLHASPEARLIDLLERVSSELRNRAAGLRPRRLRALRHIAASGRRGAAQGDLARVLGLSHPALSRLCDTLETEGLVVREWHPVDRRRKSVLLTEAGRLRLATCDAVADGEAAAVGLSAHELEKLTGLLARVAAGLSSRTRPAAPDLAISRGS